ncbi:transmembrane protein 154 [Pungitius pungitius]|uniref:transmembrane protein 154 n=1 Tax=Pungitius pungitius TaxID=134920 RepID=UPI002E10D8C8
MFAGGTGNMRGPRMKTPLLLLLLLLLTTRTGTETPESVSDATEEPKPEEYNENTDAEGTGSGSRPPLNESSDPTEGRNGTGRGAAPGQEEGEEQWKEEEEEEGLSLIIILIPAVLAVIIIGMVVGGIFINRRWNQKARNQELRKEDPYLDGSSSEKVPMPMFEEDVPSVLELEMEELDQWMKKDSDPSEDSKLA